MIVIRWFGIILWLTAIALAQPSLGESSPDRLQQPVDSAALTMAAPTENELLRWPVRTVEDWLALRPGLAVRYPGHESIHVRGARDYTNISLFRNVAIEDPQTGFPLGTFSPFVQREFFLNSPANTPYTTSGGIIDSRLAPWQGTVEITTDQLTDQRDRNWYNATLQSPSVQGWPRLFLSLERSFLGDRRSSPITDRIVPNDENALPGNSLQGWSHHAALSWDVPGPAILTAWVDYTRDEYQSYDHSFYFLPEHMPRTEDQFADIGVQLRTRLSPRARLHLTASVSEHQRRHGDGVVFDDRDAYYRGIDNPQHNSWFQYFHVSDSLGNEPYYSFFFVQDTRQLQFTGELSVNFSRRHVLDITPLVRVIQASLSDQYLNKSALLFALRVTDSWQFGNLYVSGSVQGEYWSLNPPRTYYVGGDGVTPGPTPSQPTRVFGSGYSLGALSPTILLSYDVNRLILKAEAGLTHDLPPLQVMHSGPISVGHLSFEHRYYSRGAIEANLGPGLKLAVEGFYDYYSNLIDGNQGAFRDWLGIDEGYHFVHQRYLQYGKARAFGVTARIKASPNEHLKLSVSHTVSKSETTVRETPFDVWQKIDVPGIMRDHNGYPDYVDAFHDQPHKFVATVDWHPGENYGPSVGSIRPLANLSLVTTFYAATGFTFLPRDPIQTDLTRQPAVYQVDFRLEKSFAWSGVRLIPFVWVKNLFDRHNAAYVFDTSGEPDQTGYLDTPEGQQQAADDPVWLEQYLLYQNNPTHFAPPRQIYLGVRPEF